MEYIILLIFSFFTEAVILWHSQIGETDESNLG